MASTPRASLDDSYILGITCAICGADGLSVNHVPNLPDYVTCKECGSAFLVEEGGDRVFYGQIAAGYEETERFALKQWAWLEAIETRAREERPRPEGEQPLPDPETIEESLSEDERVESQSAEDWISTEIPALDLVDEGQQAIEATIPDTEGFAEVPEPEIEVGEEAFAIAGEPPSLQGIDAIVEETIDDMGRPDAEEQGLADFFDALTDEAVPDVEPEAPIASEEPGSPLIADLDDDLERLLKTEEDTGPELAPPPWVSKEEDEFIGISDISDDEPLPAWDEVEASEPQSVEETAPDIPAWQSADDSEPEVGLPSWDDLQGAEVEDTEAQTPGWALTPEEEEQTEDLPAWDAFDEQAPIPVSDSEPETPDWALPSDEPSPPAYTADEGLQEPAWGAAISEEPSPAWEDVSGALAEEAVDDEDDFLSGLRRSAAVPLESEPISDQPLGDDEFESEMAWEDEEVDVSARIESFSRSAEPPDPVAAGWEMTAAAAVQATPEPEPEPEPAPIPAKPLLDEDYVPPASDPPPGQRSRVALRGERVIFPSGECAHCGRTPTKGKLAVAGTLPRGQTVGQRRPTRFEIPLCGSCRNRAASKSEDAKAAQLQAHLISGIVGMILVVGALALDIINPRDLKVVDLFLGLILLIVGYGGPAYFLLNRVGSYLPPVDARYVRTTLLVPQETQGLETAFEWRNQEYAQHFHDVNQANVLGNVTSVKDRMA